MAAVVRALARAYPDPHTALRYGNPFELLIATILSAQCTDEVVNKVTPTLFSRYPTPADLAAADPAVVEKIVHRTGFFRQKTKAIIGASRGLVERFGAQVPRTIEELTSLPGVARKTANVVLANCWPRPRSEHGIFVDTHVRRVANRLGFTSSDDPIRIEQDLMALVPPGKWADVPHQLIELGRGPCNAKRPRHEECPLLRWCPTGKAALAQS